MNFYIQNENPHLFGYAHAPPNHPAVPCQRLFSVTARATADAEKEQGRCAAGRRVVKWRGLWRCAARDVGHDCKHEPFLFSLCALCGACLASLGAVVLWSTKVHFRSYSLDVNYIRINRAFI